MINREALVNVGLLVLRVGIGIIFVFHGLHKLMVGVETWTQLGATMSVMGLTFAPVFWGFMAAATEVGGGLFIIFGLLHRLVALMLIFTMVVALLVHVAAGAPFAGSSNALKALVVFVAFAISGPGIYSLDYKFLRRIA